MGIQLKKTDRLLIVQFDLSNENALPFKLSDRGTETKEDAQSRKTQNRRHDYSNRLTDEKGSIFAAYLPISLHENGFILVSADHRRRIDKKNPKIFYNAIRYTFVRKEFENKSDPKLVEFLPWRGIHCAGMQELCELANWDQVRIYRNPFYMNGEPVSGFSSISINFDARKPLYENDAASFAFTPDPSNKPDCLLVIANGSLMFDRNI